MRLDKYLAIMDLVKSRSSGVHLIKSGSVKVNGKSVLKPSYIVKEGDKIEITEKEIFVGRGGYKIRGFFEDLSEMEQDDLEIFDGLGKVNDENERSPNMQNEDDHNSKYKNLISNLIENKIILDIGCSTGGFSNFFLKNNASLVIGLDIAKEVVDLDLLKHENFIFLGGYDVLQDKIWKNKLDEVLKMRFDEISIYIHDKETVKSYYKH
ncbi:MAG: S4 domain-containing protein [Promethearchaeota archaeon]